MIHKGIFKEIFFFKCEGRSCLESVRGWNCSNCSNAACRTVRLGSIDDLSDSDNKSALQDYCIGLETGAEILRYKGE